MELTTTYKISEGFKEWLKEKRPGAYSAILRLDCEFKELKLTAAMDQYLRPKRFRLTFPFSYKDLDTFEQQHFDRQIDSPDGCIVLDHHPDILNTNKLFKPKGPIKPGDTFPMNLNKLPHDKGITVQVTVKSIEYYMAELELPGGYTFTVDVDELATWDC